MHSRDGDKQNVAQIIKELYTDAIAEERQDKSFMAIVRDDDGELHYTSEDDVIR